MADILISRIGTKDLHGCEQSSAAGPLVSILRFADIYHKLNKVKFIQSTLEQVVQFVDISFDIAADFLPLKWISQKYERIWRR